MRPFVNKNRRPRRPTTRLRRALALIVKLPNGALEALVQGSGYVGRNRPEPRPLRLRVPDLLLRRTPARVFELRRATVRHGVGSETLAPLLGEQLRGCQLGSRLRRRVPVTGRGVPDILRLATSSSRLG